MRFIITLHLLYNTNIGHPLSIHFSVLPLTQDFACVVVVAEVIDRMVLPIPLSVIALFGRGGGGPWTAIHDAITSPSFPS